jgi:tRNA-specific 2-thiouridylase
MTRVKAISLLSGGLDSILATKLILNQGIEVIAFNVKTPFGIPKKDGTSEAEEAVKQLNVPLKVLPVEKDYIKMVCNPKHGYGKNMNPCVDCKIFILKKAAIYAKEVGADFLFTGEVLGERPMSQHGPALRTIEEEAGLKGKLLRPLSAKLLPETVAERKGLVDRNKLMAISGRSRKPQFQLAKEFGITNYPSPAGGCLLTCEEYSKKLNDLIKHKKVVSASDAGLLHIGRHIVGPVTVLQGAKTKKAIQTAAGLTAFYSDAKLDKVKVNFGRECLDKSLVVEIPDRVDVDKLRIGSCK